MEVLVGRREKLRKGRATCGTEAPAGVCSVDRDSLACCHGGSCGDSAGDAMQWRLSEQKEGNEWLGGAAMPASHAFLQTVLSVSEGTRVRGATVFQASITHSPAT